MRVALLEDQPIQMQLMVATLETFPIDVDEAINCAEFTDSAALRTALLTDPFDLLILDWNFDRMNGLDLVRWLRASGMTELPVILVSARSGSGDAAEALASGADDYVVKPFRSGQLLARVQQLMKTVPRRRTLPRTPSESSRAPVRPPTACGAGS